MVYESEDRVIAPWSPDEVDSINGYQEQIFMTQTYVCGPHTNHRPMIAEENAMVCPECGHKQHWCFLIAADWSWKDKLKKPEKFDPRKKPYPTYWFGMPNG